MNGLRRYGTHTAYNGILLSKKRDRNLAVYDMDLEDIMLSEISQRKENTM